MQPSEIAAWLPVMRRTTCFDPDCAAKKRLTSASGQVRQVTKSSAGELPVLRAYRDDGAGRIELDPP